LRVLAERMENEDTIPGINSIAFATANNVGAL
jgi:hypothetical protein